MAVRKHAAILAIGLLALTTLAFAQRVPGSRGMRSYNPATEVTLTSVVVDEVKQIPGPANGPGGVHLIVRAQTGPVEVDLGPSGFITSKNFELMKGDIVTVIGSKAQRVGHEVIIAREITKGDKVLSLRDANGRPLWAGRGRR
jgi:hypothetical protein